MNKKLAWLIRLLPAGLAMGTAWAARGQIGHEYGAAWAAAIGTMAVLALSGRKDWYNRFPVIVAAAALGWGAGGMISYGRVVGYGMAPDLWNTAYGLAMLLLIGAIYGFLGGGLTGLAMETTSAKKPDWAGLLTQMFAGGFLCWGFFIYQLEWLMTPPRSELWAGCLGACLALGAYLYRGGYPHALRTAFFAALGAGFGFAFGNFVQRLGYLTGLSFNWWNAMEYSIGFFGGLGLAYGMLTGPRWPTAEAPSAFSQRLSLVFLLIGLPLLNLLEGVNREALAHMGERLQVHAPLSFSLRWQLVAWILSAFAMVLSWRWWRRPLQQAMDARSMTRVALGYLVWYILLSNIIGGTWLTPVFSSQHLYWVNFFLLILLLPRKDRDDPFSQPVDTLSCIPKWWLWCLLVLLAVWILSLLTTAFHDSPGGTQWRFK